MTTPHHQHSLDILKIFISPDHNFLGHHGNPPGETPVAERDSIECFAGKGIMGDRFFDHKPDYKGQITFFQFEVYESLCNELELSPEQVCPSVFRRNVIVRGVDLNSLIGKRFQIGDIEFSGSEECSPCYWMDSACKPGAHAFLKGRGGLRARIHCDGELSVGPQTLSVLD